MEVRDYEVNGRRYQIMLPSVRDAMRLVTRATTLLGPLLGGLFSEGAELAKGAAGKDRMEAILGHLGEALSRVDSEGTDALLMDAVGAAHLCYDGQPVSSPHEFERHFGQYRADVYPVMVWALWESVRDFFPDLGAFTQMAQRAMKAAEASPSPTAGPRTTGSDALSGRARAPGRR